MHSCASPHVATLKKGESIYICRCGHTKTPPYCDGSHSNYPGIEPLAYIATADESVYICGCGKSANKPWCDGSHSGA